MRSAISVEIMRLHPKGRHPWFSIQSQKQKKYCDFQSWKEEWNPETIL